MAKILTYADMATVLPDDVPPRYTEIAYFRAVHVGHGEVTIRIERGPLGQRFGWLTCACGDLLDLSFLPYFQAMTAPTVGHGMDPRVKAAVASVVQQHEAQAKAAVVPDQPTASKVLHGSIRAGSDGRYGLLLECAACAHPLKGITSLSLILSSTDYPHAWLWPSPEPFWVHLRASPACGVYQLPRGQARQDPQRWQLGSVAHVQEVDASVEYWARAAQQQFERALKEML